MQAVGSSGVGSQGRYARGVKSPRPELLRRMKDLLAEEPSISKSELARRLSVTRATATYYLRALGAEIQVAKARVGESKEKAMMTHLELLDRLSTATNEIQRVIGELRSEPTSPSTAGAVFRGYAVLQSYLRLLGELLGEVSPPQTNVYLTRVETLLASPVTPGPAVQAVLDEAQRDGSTR